MKKQVNIVNDTENRPLDIKDQAIIAQATSVEHKIFLSDIQS